MNLLTTKDYILLSYSEKVQATFQAALRRCLRTTAMADDPD